MTHRIGPSPRGYSRGHVIGPPGPLPRGGRHIIGNGMDPPAFDMTTLTSGVSRLPRVLTINSIGVAPSLWYNGVDATAATWPAEYGPDLAIGGSAPAVELAVGAPFLDDSNAVRGEGGEYYTTAGAAAAAEIELEDFVIEGVIRVPAVAPAGALRLLGAREG